MQMVIETIRFFSAQRYSTFFVVLLLGFQQGWAGAAAISSRDTQCIGLLGVATGNPLLTPSSLPFGAVPYDKLNPTVFREAFDFAIRETAAQLRGVRSQSAAPDFINTVEALERATLTLDRVERVFFHLKKVQKSKDLEQIQHEVQPRLTRLNLALHLDPVLLSRVQQLYAQKDRLGLNPEQSMLLQKWHDAFLEGGAHLPADQRQRLREIQIRLDELRLQFSSHLQEDRNVIFWITDGARLKGAAPNVIAAAAQLAAQNGRPGQWAYTLKYPSYGPLLNTIEDRALRQEIWEHSSRVGKTGATDNRLIILEIARLTHEAAKIHGYQSYAERVLVKRMAKDLASVEAFLHRLANGYLDVATTEQHELETFAGHAIMPWDYGYYSEKLRLQKFGFSSDAFRPYLSYPSVVEGLLSSSTQRYQIRFLERTDIPTWDAAVRVFEVQDLNSRHLGLFYLDPFPRDNKEQGAWSMAISVGHKLDGQRVSPHVVNSLNITQPSGNDPALLALGEVISLYHEKGHALHSLLTQTQYPSLAGTAVMRDFVELPSQINQRWALHPDHLKLYARHFQTGQPIPDHLVRQLQESDGFRGATAGMGQVSLGILDLAWYGRFPKGLQTAQDVEDWELRVLMPYRVLGVLHPGATRSATFGHIFDGGYAAGYYGYKWADVLAADAFEVFERAGIFDLSTAQRFRQEILEKGGSEHPAELYRRFKGSDPDPDALLRAEGLLPQGPKK